MTTVALIDGDIVLHRVGYTTDNDPEWIARARVDEMLDGILLDTDAREFEIWLSDSRENNFRYEVWPEYKANRVHLPRPVHYEAIKEYLITEWQARIALGMEADDALGINQTETSVICSIDKDLLQIPGQHYNFVRKEWNVVEPWEGLCWFYRQILIGDVSDNIEGCTGIGPVRSGRIVGRINHREGEDALFQAIFETYQDKEGRSSENPKGKTDEEILKHILLVGRLLKIKQEEGEPLWDFPSSSLTQESKSVSTPPKPEESSQSTEPTKVVPENGSPPLGEPTVNGSPAAPPPSTSVKQ